MYGTVFNIQRFCVSDGNGIRTTVFLKGCPLACKWCHNPDGMSASAILAFYEDLCISCKRCAGVCDRNAHFADGVRLDRSKCTLCGKCVTACPAGALEIIGKRYSAEQVIDECLKDKTFYENSGGGITLSGGEPLYQAEFATEILELARRAGLDTAVETSGCVDRSKIADAARFSDTFLFDYKVTGADKSLNYTGSDGRAALENLDYLGSIDKTVILRCPIIPGVNDDEEHFRAIAAIGNKYKNIVRIEVLPYHRFGLGKSKSMGVEPPFVAEEFTAERVCDMRAAIAAHYLGEVVSV